MCAKLNPVLDTAFSQKGRTDQQHDWLGQCADDLAAYSWVTHKRQGELRVDFQSGHDFVQVRIVESRSHKIICSIELVDTNGSTLTSRVQQALKLFQTRVNASLRTVKLIRHGKQYRLEAQLSKAQVQEDLVAIVEALTTAWLYFGKEARALLDPVLANAYLNSHKQRKERKS